MFGPNFPRYGSKSSGFVEAIILRGTLFHRGGYRVEEKGLVFDDGSTFDCDIIVACTGEPPNELTGRG